MYLTWYLTKKQNLQIVFYWTWKDSWPVNKVIWTPNSRHALDYKKYKYQSSETCGQSLPSKHLGNIWTEQSKVNFSEFSFYRLKPKIYIILACPCEFIHNTQWGFRHNVHKYFMKKIIVTGSKNIATICWSMPQKFWIVLVYNRCVTIKRSFTKEQSNNKSTITSARFYLLI